MNSKIIKIFFSLLFFSAAIVFFVWDTDETSQPNKENYYHNQGYIFGTYYNIRYSAKNDLEQGIKRTMQEFDGSLSTFNKESVISRINRNESGQTDDSFNRMYTKAYEIYGLSNGAFDITVAPLVNAWGFGFSNKENISDNLIDSLRRYVGMDKISLENDVLLKTDKHIMLDASAIAKGQACDVVAEYLRQQGCRNLLVDIGGEVVLQGRNQNGEPWRVGITKPQDNLTATQNDIQEVLSSTSLAMATSGNYRQFYIENGIRRSHTIDPRSGYPVNHSLLSATVVAEDCMTADALATACMVLGTDSALLMIENRPETECYLIYATDTATAVVFSSGMSTLIQHD